MELFSLQTALAWIIAGVAAYLGAYLATKGKNLARKEDLNGLLAEVRAVTIAQKEIEAKISGALWNRQMVWNQKRDIYARLLESMNELELSVSVLSKFFAMKPMGNLSDLVREHNERATQVGRDLERALAVAPIYLPQNAIATLRDLKTALSKPAPELEYPAVCLALARAQDTLISAAKADLGIETVIPTSHSA